MNTFSNKIIQAKFDIWKNINLLNCMAESFIRKTLTHFLRTIKVILLDVLIALYHKISRSKEKAQQATLSPEPLVVLAVSEWRRLRNQ